MELAENLRARTAAELVDEVAAMEGVDMLYVGPSDLSVALGHPGQLDHPEVLEVVDRVGRACREQGKLAGAHFSSPDILEDLLGRGIHFLGFSSIERMLILGVADRGESPRQAISAAQS